MNSSIRISINIRHVLIFLFVVLGCGLRLYLSTIGETNDVITFQKNGVGIFCSFPTCYREDSTIPVAPLYGPLSLYILEMAEGISDLFLYETTPQETVVGVYHIALASLLTVCDLAIFSAILWYFGLVPSAIFFLSPLSFLITGYHSQLDTVAVLFALLAMLAIPRSLWGAAILIAISLLIKQIFLFIPIVLLVCPYVGSFSRRVAFAAICYVVYAVAWIPMLTHPETYGHVVQNWSSWSINDGVGLSGTTALREILLLFFPDRFLDVHFGAEKITVIKIIFVSMVVSTAALFARRNEPVLVLAFFSLVIVAVSPRIAAQYFTICAIGFAFLYRWRYLWFVHIVATVVLATSRDNIAAVYVDFMRRPRDRLLDYNFEQIQAFLLVFVVFIMVTFLLQYGRDLKNRFAEIGLVYSRDVFRNPKDSVRLLFLETFRADTALDVERCRAGPTNFKT